MEILLKHIRVRDFDNAISLIIQALKVGLAANISEPLLNSAFRYLIDAKEVKEIKQLIEQINIDIPHVKDNIMTYAEELLQQGKRDGFHLGEEKGRLEGKLEGKIEGKQETQLEIARNLLNSGISEEVVAEATKLPLSKIKTLH